MVMKPAWLEGLISEKFFAVCGIHENRRKNEKNIFCLTCCRSICAHCLPSHRSHTLLQVRRYVYTDVVRLDEMRKLMDCCHVQPYTINNAKVVFLNQRPQTKQFKRHDSVCFTCDRILQDSYHFCSISCKVDHVVMQGGDLSRILYRFDESEFACSQFEDLGMEISEAMEEDDDQFNASPCSSDFGSNNSSVSHDTEIVKKKKKAGSGFFPGIVMSLSRRKGAPHRSPLS